MGDEKSFCEQCGQPLNAEAKFCGGCGRRVVPAFALPLEAEPVASPRRQSRLPWIICGVAIVAIGGLAGGYYWGKSGGVPAPETVMTAPVPTEPKTEPPPRHESQSPAVPHSTDTAGGRETGFAALPPPPSVDRQSEFTPLPPPPPLDQNDEAAPPSPPPPDSSQDLPTETSEGPRWPWTSQRLVTQEDLSQLSPWELIVMRNEIYARHGWVFERADLQDYFGQQPWYRPKGTMENRESANRLAEVELTALERHNVKAILHYEKVQQGGR
jgi:hypothetical protein